MTYDYPVHEIFTSVQGEGSQVGRPTVFIRLLGCNLSCKFCDTTQPEITPGRMWSTEQIVETALDAIGEYRIRWACITGGEPTQHNLALLIALLQKAGRKVCIETNGTRALTTDENPNWIAVSPKWPPGVEGLSLKYGHEMKVPVYKELPDEEILKALYFGRFQWKFLQPVDDENWQHNVERAIELCFRTGARISGQLHKRLGVA